MIYFLKMTHTHTYTSTASFSLGPQQLRLGQVEARNQKFHPGLYEAGRSPDMESSVATSQVYQQGVGLEV